MVMNMNSRGLEGRLLAGRWEIFPFTISSCNEPRIPNLVLFISSDSLAAGNASHSCFDFLLSFSLVPFYFMIPPIQAWANEMLALHYLT